MKPPSDREWMQEARTRLERLARLEAELERRKGLDVKRRSSAAWLSNFPELPEPLARRLTRIGLELWHGRRLSLADRFLAMVVLAQRANEHARERYGRTGSTSSVYLAECAAELIAWGMPRKAAILSVMTEGADDVRAFGRIARALDRLKPKNFERQKRAHAVARKTSRKAA